MVAKEDEKWYDKPISRRDFIKKAGMMGAGAMMAPSIMKLLFGGTSPKDALALEEANQAIPFYGKRQSGITTPIQRQVYFAVLDMATEDLETIRGIFKSWTTYIARMMQGELVEAYKSNTMLPPTDTGEAVGMGTERLTITVGVSPSFLDKLKLTSKKLPELEDLPKFARDQLQEDFTGGDICIQACAEDAQVAFHAVRNLLRKGREHLTLKWSQTGYAAITSQGSTPRNLFGFKDGTANVTSQDDFDRVIWCDQDNWMKNGTYLIVRRVQMHLETWDRTSLKEQENTFGRHRDSGAPLGAVDEFDPVDLELKDDKGNLVIPEDCHVRLAKEVGEEIYRRAFSYANGIDPRTGQFDAGLLFISFQKDPQQFIKVQKNLGTKDKLNEYITHVGSGLFAILPGVEEGGYLGQSLFE
ncbi:iron uptake transporter deferrochelatase/peroxidase subunit [uncultured Abiotrophia sp.]|uniref:iron uptake transporter deferrochelatase/peroxidase subunit n=1 Tax=uncultured Abiotrophia sp. TaxID=316094 RepID=UPI00260EAC3F|nr:iron uptake transporter deferrochelatase/peroxidase subunit [uncultured Abiotrophia sp.]